MVHARSTVGSRRRSPPRGPRLRTLLSALVLLPLTLLLAQPAQARRARPNKPAGWTELREAARAFRVGDLPRAKAGLGSLLPRLRGQSDALLAARFVAARVYAGLGDGNAAREALAQTTKLRALVPQAWAFAEIEVLTAEGKHAQAHEALGKLRDRWPKFRWAQADLTWSRLYERLGPPARSASAALELYEKSHLHLPQDELLARAARGYEAAGEAKRAQGAWRKLLLRHPESALVDEAVRRIPLESLSLAERLDRAELLFKRRDYERCRTESLFLWEKQHRRDIVGYLLGKIGSERLRDDYEGAARYFEAALDPGAPYAMFALASYGIVLGKLGRVKEAVEAFDRWLARYRKSAGIKRVNETMYDRCRAIHVGGDSLRAAREYQAFLESNRSGFDWGKYWWFVAFWHYQGGKYEEAIDQMARLRGSSNPLVGGKARYWTGKAQDKLGKTAEAKATMLKLVADMPLNYYSGLAENWLVDHGFGKALPKRPDLSKVRWRVPDAFAGLPKTGAVQELRIIAHLGEFDTLREALADRQAALRRQLGAKRLDQLESDLSDALEDFARDRGRAYGRWRKDLRKWPTTRTVDHWRAIYPRAYATHVKWAADRFGAPEWMVYAHMLQESRYKPWMISGAPAYGLLELLDRTARRLAAEQKEDYQLWMLMVPGHNVRWGTQYLGALVAKFKGQIPFAIASYNGGPMLLEFHMQESKGKDFDVMIDDMGPHECRNYVRMVIGHFLRYIAIYETPKRAEALRAKLLPRTWEASWNKHPDY
ncbi:MAG: hypothetical protein RIT45_4016 [Pseudomonadota bacterium]